MQPRRPSWRSGRARSLPPPAQRDHPRHLRADRDRRGRPGQRLRPRLRRRRQRHPGLAAVRRPACCPFLQQNAVIEFSHRVAATIVVVLIAALALQAFRRLRDHRWLVRGSVAAGVLVLAQAALGGLTVEHGLALGARRRPPRAGDAAARPADHPAPDRTAGRAARRRWTARARCARPRPWRRCSCWRRSSPAATSPAPRARERRTSRCSGAHLACGEQFPTCLDKFMPFAVRAARRHPAHPPAVHVPDRDRRPGDGGGGAAAAGARAAPFCDRARCSLVVPDPARRDERLARQAPRR